MYAIRTNQCKHLCIRTRPFFAFNPIFALEAIECEIEQEMELIKITKVKYRSIYQPIFYDILRWRGKQKKLNCTTPPPLRQSTPSPASAPYRDSKHNPDFVNYTAQSRAAKPVHPSYPSLLHRI
jgi:hypothetical protein